MHHRTAESVLSRILVPALAALVLFPGCGSEDHVNEPPTARLVSAPPEGSEVSFRVSFTWTGTDPDGRVDRFEYAVDPPAAFTEDEIAHGGPGVVSTTVPGENGAPDVTRVGKTVDGITVSFDWIHTGDTGGTFPFSATRADSTGEDTLRAPTGRFTGPEVQEKPSDYQGLLTGLRWHDPDPAQAQRRIQWFGFPLYYFRDDQAQETFNRSLDWFRESETPAR